MTENVVRITELKTAIANLDKQDVAELKSLVEDLRYELPDGAVTMGVYPMPSMDIPNAVKSWFTDAVAMDAAGYIWCWARNEIISLAEAQEHLAAVAAEAQWMKS